MFDRKLIKPSLKKDSSDSISHSEFGEAVSFQCSASGGIIIADELCSHFFGVKENESLVGRSLQDLAAPAIEDNLKKLLARSIIRREDSELELAHLITRKVTVFKLSPVYDKDQFVCFIVKGGEEPASNARQFCELIAKMSHDIKTPINSILGFSRLLMDGEKSEIQAQYAESIESSGNDLLAMLVDLIDLAKIESGRLMFQPEWSYLPTLADEWQTELEYQAKKVGTVATVKLIGDASREVYIDLKRTKEFVHRVVKCFGIENLDIRICVEESVRPARPYLFALEFVLKDKGENGESPFARLKSILANGGETLPSGIAKEKDLALSMIGIFGGVINATVEVCGSKSDRLRVLFKETRLRQIDTRMRTVFSSVEDLKGLKALSVVAVDDSSLNRLLIKRLFDSTPHKLSVASNAKEALVMIQDQKTDVIVSDVCMPDMSGIEMAEKIGTLPDCICKKIVFVSADQPSVNEELGKVVEHSFVEKPPTSSALAKAILSLDASFLDKDSSVTEKKAVTKGNRITFRTCDLHGIDLVKHLGCLQEGVWSGFRTRMDLDQLDEFAQELGDLGAEKCSEGICQIADSVKAYLEEFDLSALESVLDDLEAVCFDQNN